MLICSYNEEQTILERTIVGAQAMDYPNFRVWMLDDSRRDWLKALCARLGCRYVSRPDNRRRTTNLGGQEFESLRARPAG